MAQLPRLTMLRKMAWRRFKIQELRDPVLFRREYPADPSEAWTAPPGHEPFINSLSVLRARKRQGVEGVGPLVIGVDPASNGGDRFSITWRRGLRIEKQEHRNKIDILEAFAWCKLILTGDQPARMNIDAGNIGAALVTMLKTHSPKFAEIVRGVNFGGTSEAKLARPKVPGPKNRRAEMWMRLRDWLDLEVGTSIPDSEALQADLVAPKLKPQLDNDFLLESKKEMKDRGVRSPDLGDSAALTFASNEYFTGYVEGEVKQKFGDIDTPAAIRQPVREQVGGSQGWMM
jgi:hypothetical protein